VLKEVLSEISDDGLWFKKVGARTSFLVQTCSRQLTVGSQPRCLCESENQIRRERITNKYEPQIQARAQQCADRMEELFAPLISPADLVPSADLVGSLPLFDDEDAESIPESTDSASEKNSSVTRWFKWKQDLVAVFKKAMELRMKMAITDGKYDFLFAVPGKNYRV
jgi:hypothetical protein